MQYLVMGLGGLGIMLAIAFGLLALRFASVRAEVGTLKENMVTVTIERDTARLEAAGFRERLARVEGVVADQNLRLKKAQELLLKHGGNAGDLWDVVRGGTT